MLGALPELVHTAILGTAPLEKKKAHTFATDPSVLVEFPFLFCAVA